jgi:hypothetical protein
MAQAGKTGQTMATTESDRIIPVAVMAELQAAADRAAKGVRDPHIMVKACERMDRLREEIRRKHGTLDIGVAAIRELRDGE